MRCSTLEPDKYGAFSHHWGILNFMATSQNRAIIHGYKTVSFVGVVKHDNVCGSRQVSAKHIFYIPYLRLYFPNVYLPFLYHQQQKYELMVAALY